MNEIAVIHAGAIGDLVQTLPTLRAVRARWPAARVTFVGHPARAVLALRAGACDAWTDLETCGLERVLALFPEGHNPPQRGATGGLSASVPGALAASSQWHPANGGASAFPETAQGDAVAPLPPPLAQADLVLDFLTRGALAARAGGRGPPRVVSLAPLPPEDWTRPAAEWIFEEAARHLDLPGVPLVPEIGVAHGMLETGRRLLTDSGIAGRFVAIHPGSGSARKNWPPDRFAQVAARVRREAGRAAAWLLGPAELERGPAPAVGPGDSCCASEPRCFAEQDAVLANLPLDRVAAVLALADAYLGNDSGVTQVAAAVRRPDGRATPVVALFGPTDPRVWAPQGPHVRVIRSPDGTLAALGTPEVWDALRDALK